jgi:hypothetical protein
MTTARSASDGRSAINIQNAGTLVAMPEKIAKPAIVPLTCTITSYIHDGHPSRGA